MEMVIN